MEQLLASKQVLQQPNAQDYYIHVPSAPTNQIPPHHYSNRLANQGSSSREGTLMINKENKLQNLLMAVELNRTAANEQRRS